MAKAKKSDFGDVTIRCPGCKQYHSLNVDPAQKGPCWGFNGDLDKPTFTPSLLVHSGHFVKGYETKECWCSYKERFGEDPPFACGVCHSFIRDGMIEFLNDSTHALAGQTVPLGDIE